MINTFFQLFPDCAPRSVAYITELLGSRSCGGCRIVRAEDRGRSWDSKGDHMWRVSSLFPVIVDYDFVPVRSDTVVNRYSRYKWYDPWFGPSTSQKTAKNYNIYNSDKNI